MPRKEDSIIPLRRLEQLVTLTTCTWLEGTCTSWHINKHNKYHESSRWHYFTAPRASALGGQFNPELPREHQSIWMLLVIWSRMVNLAAQEKQWSWLYTCKNIPQPPHTISTAQKTKAWKTHYRGGSAGTQRTLETAQVGHTDKWFYTLTSISKKGGKWWVPREYHL